MSDIYDDHRAALEALRVEAQGARFDYESPTGNKAARSYVYGLRQAKARIEDTRKAAKAEVLARGKEIDEGARVLTSEIDDLIAVHAKRIAEIEEREAARVAAHKHALEYIASRTESLRASWMTIRPEEFDKDELALKKAIERNWEEYEEAAAGATTAYSLALEDAKRQRREYDEAQKELEALRAEKAQRAAEEEERRRKEEEERKAAAMEARAAERARIAAEDAERRAREEARAVADAEIAKEREQAQAKIDEANRRAAQLEREQQERLARERAEAEELAQREADLVHTQAVRAAILDALLSVDAGLSRPRARAIVDAIEAGRVPHVSITY